MDAMTDIELKTSTCDHCESDAKKASGSVPVVNWKKILTIISASSLVLAWVSGWLSLPEAMVGYLYYFSIASGGYFVVLAAIRGLWRQRFLNIDFLVTVAAIGAIYINQLAEAASVILFFSLAEFFEDFGVEKSKKALESLLNRSPQTASLKNGKTVSVEDVKIGDIVIVRPGDLVPMDGVVVEGFSSIDEATITGEAIPKDKREMDTVFAGTLNQNGYLEVRVTKESKDSTFGKIIQLVERAQTSRAPVQEFIDTFAKYYTPAIVGIALLIATVPPVFFAGVFQDWLYRALVLLVIACPCALVISTPVAIASAIGGASRRGILIKGGKYLDLLSRIKAVAFDKTRTLTEGRPIISDVVTFNGFKEEDVIADAAGIETFSSHPLAQSIVEFAQERKIVPHAMSTYENVAGKGGKAVCLICNDLKHCIGNLKFIGAESTTGEEIISKTGEYEKQGKTVVLISEGERVMGALTVSDKIRDSSKKTIQKLKERGVESVILTGDNQHTADFVAKVVGIKTVYGSLLPDEKVKKVEELKSQFGTVAMVGDGVNDAPSLVTAHVGIAMGAGGSDVAIETADVALMNDNLLNVPTAIQLGKRTVKTIRLNIAAALGVKVFFLILALTGFTHLEYAIGADSGMAMLVILNGLRLFSVEKPSDP